MAIVYEIQDRVLFFRVDGDYHLADIRQKLDEAIASPDFRAPMYLLADARASKANPPFSEVRETATYLGSIREHFDPTWILVVQGSLRYGLARMLSVFAEEFGIELIALRDLEEGWSRAREISH